MAAELPLIARGKLQFASPNPDQNLESARCEFRQQIINYIYVWSSDKHTIYKQLQQRYLCEEKQKKH